ncbi:uncharacterized protein LOC114322669 isoform X3 [Camellia sinensis]|uniref:uncharacterized protein LOC114322669 isoform X3 n=1 Tax=Camellia sinensis TaxID=4442 RepID=UPI0010367FD5|nr:uncharacterized protein LOC114322669 isoform X3 [Camellia sinensis]
MKQGFIKCHPYLPSTPQISCVFIFYDQSSLASEARLAGPVHYRWMYSVERYLSRLKSYVRNRSRPEGSMAKGYLANECLTFCSRYMEGVETRFNQMSQNYDEGGNGTEGLSIFSMPGRPLGKGVIDTMDDGTKEKAHRYVLFNCETVNKFIEQHRRLVSIQNPRLREMAIDRIHSETFPTWFDKHVSSVLKFLKI